MGMKSSSADKGRLSILLRQLKLMIISQEPLGDLDNHFCGSQDLPLFPSKHHYVFVVSFNNPCTPRSCNSKLLTELQFSITDNHVNPLGSHSCTCLSYCSNVLKEFGALPPEYAVFRKVTSLIDQALCTILSIIV